MKDQKYIAFDEQLRGEVAAALDQGRSLNLILGPNVQRLTNPLINGVASTGGQITRYDPSTDIQTPYTQP